jgi:hypothetical protein
MVKQPGNNGKDRCTILQLRIQIRIICMQNPAACSTTYNNKLMAVNSQSNMNNIRKESENIIAEIRTS